MASTPIFLGEYISSHLTTTFSHSSSHIHWYERLYPLGINGTIDKASVVDNHTYNTNAGQSMTHIINGMAGNIESHSELSPGQNLSDFTAVLNTKEYGFSKMTVVNATALKWEYIRGTDGAVGDYLWLLKPSSGLGVRKPHGVLH